MKFKKIYFFITIFFVFSLIINYFDWQLYGYYTEKVVAWIWILSTLIFIIFYWKNRKVKIYFFSLLALIPLSIIPMCIPFFGMYFYLTDETDFQRITLNNSYRIERTQQQVLSMPRIYIYKNYLHIFEKNVARPSYQEIIDEILGENPNGNNFDAKDSPIQKCSFVKDYGDSIAIKYRISGKEKTVIHLLNIDDGY